ncbi:MAG: NAD(P)/FAD-dependent oxidoreductase, partial [Myxococcota bacterium]
FGEQIAHCIFEDGRWKLETLSGHRDEADFVIAATGVLHHPNDPDIAGLDDFRGARFHSSRWDHTVELADKRVGIVGTGSTAVQITSAIVDAVGHLSLFQRTAQWIMPQDNPAYTDEEKREFGDRPDQIEQLRSQLSELFAQGFSNAVVDSNSPQMKLIEDMCRLNLDSNVTDSDRHEELLPNYRAACKRLVISPDFYQAIQKPSAEVVTSGIERVEAGGVRTRDGRLHELDVLVLATGFRPDRFMRPMNVIGRDDRKLDEIWADRPVAYLSISIPDLPNFFMLNGPNGPVGNFSLIEIAELQMAYILQLVELRRSGQCREISASQAAMEEFDAERVDAAKNTMWTTGCRSWYLDDRGIPAVWPWTIDRFCEQMSQPELSAYDLVG